MFLILSSLRIYYNSKDKIEYIIKKLLSKMREINKLSDHFCFKGKIVCVTGANGFIGKISRRAY